MAQYAISSLNVQYVLLTDCTTCARCIFLSKMKESNETRINISPPSVVASGVPKEPRRKYFCNRRIGLKCMRLPSTLTFAYWHSLFFSFKERSRRVAKAMRYLLWHRVPFTYFHIYFIYYIIELVCQIIFMLCFIIHIDRSMYKLYKHKKRSVSVSNSSTSKF